MSIHFLGFLYNKFGLLYLFILLYAQKTRPFLCAWSFAAIYRHVLFPRVFCSCTLPQARRSWSFSLGSPLMPFYLGRAAMAIYLRLAAHILLPQARRPWPSTSGLPPGMLPRRTEKGCRPERIPLRSKSSSPL